MFKIIGATPQDFEPVVKKDRKVQKLNQDWSTPYKLNKDGKLDEKAKAKAKAEDKAADVDAAGSESSDIDEYMNG